MAKFYVGQRVRIVRPVHKENTGITGTISALFQEWKWKGSLYGYNCDVDWDNGTPPGCISLSHTDRLEPILKLDDKVGNWEALGFHPSDFLKEKDRV